MSINNTNYYTIINKHTLPIVVETWQVVCKGLNEMKSVLLKPNEQIRMASETGEWYIDSTITGKRIGKFRDKSAYNGETVWMDDKEFQIICIEKVATFSKK